MPFTFKPFEEMTPEDYAAIGLRGGLEVHRQLRTRTKLFCRCPAGRYSYQYDAEVLRHMRPTLSELGEYDGTALMEKKTKKNIYYRIHHDTVCTYEFDDTPPFLISDEATDIALEMALLLRLNLVNELHIIRKQYLDGSIPAGFQRTTILGVNGWIPFKDRRIGITQLGLEEDSCREVSDIGHDRVYLTDRLGTPLIEVVTDPDMRTPQEVAEVGQIIRRLCLSTGRVRSGYGAARQDVNVSVRGGTRIEIKGVPQLWRIPRLIYNEARRQCALLHIRDLLHGRGVTAETLETASADVTGILAKTPFEPIRAAIGEGMRVACVMLRRFAGILNEPTQEHTLFAKEFSDRVRVVACLTRLPNLVHSDTGSDALPARDWQKLFRALRAGHEDALLLVWGMAADVETACQEIVIRAREATVGVPSDTRQALKDGTNGFERVLPGAERMYPDTDLPPLAIAPERIARAQGRVPEFVWEREARLAALGVPEHLIPALSISPHWGVFDRAVDELSVSPTLVAVVLIEGLIRFRRAGLPVAGLHDDDLLAAFRAHACGQVAREGVVSLVRRWLTALRDCPEPRPTVESVLVAWHGDEPLAEAEVAGRIAVALRESARGSFPSNAARHRFVMGLLMRTLRGRVAGTALAARVAHELAGVGTQSAATATGRTGS